VEITDDSGWTHVTSTTSLITSPSSTRGGRRRRRGGGDDDENINNAEEEKFLLLPAEPPARLTLAGLKRQYEMHSQQWKSSRTWERLQQVLQSQSQAAAAVKKSLDNVVCIGLGSPSGFVRGGWVDRRSVALYQLAALVSVLELLGSYMPYLPYLTNTYLL